MTWTRDFSDEAWDRFLQDRSDATLFHTRRWARIVQAAFPDVEDRSLWQEGPDRAVFPLFARRRAGGLLTTVWSSFPLLYGGPVPCPPGPMLREIVRTMSRRGVAYWIQGNPFATASTDALPPPGWRLEQERTHVLKLPGTEDEFWDGILSTGKRNDIRRLTRKGVVVSVGGAEDIDDYYGLYLKRVASWTRRPPLVLPKEYFLAVNRIGGDSVRLYTARFEDKLIGGTFVARWGDKVHYVAGHFDVEARSLRPNVLVQNSIIRDAIRDGFAIYDMMPSGGLRNVEVFKESFGSEPVVFGRLEKEAPLRGTLRRLWSLVRREGPKPD